ncbi:unnamed protein product [Paramecium sonneborni]|uniref:R-spondin Fu-CRD domain-containing protein n=1 Tax=Paramecium sonneborni TaxID=65129 RepID=A0A8S1N746_9CILI|nr:unnamed protein product [Paramecium sonneborni]
MMLILVIFSILENINTSRVYQELSEVQLNQSSNIMRCTLLNKIDFYYLSQIQPNVNYEFKILESHFAVDIFVDFYLRGDYINKSINIILDGILIDQYSVQNDHSVPFCDDNQIQANTYFKTYTHYQQNLNLAFQLENSINFSLGIRNIQIIPKQCHESCSQCVGPEKNQCRSCFIGAQLSKKTNECKCPSIIPYLSLNQNQCINKCELNEYFDEILDMCVLDDKQEQINQYFWNIYDFTGWSMIENGKISPLIDKFYINMNEKGVGKFFSGQSINYRLNNAQPYQQLRIRGDIFIFKSQYQPEIYVQVDKINKLITPLHYKNETESKGYLLYHIDYIIDALPISNITISVTSNNNLLWGINQIVINTINCQANCNSCKSKLFCSTCKIGYYLYLGKCVTQCPNYSIQNNQVCKDATEEYPLTTTLLRAFDDNLITNFIVKNTKSIHSFYQNQFGTFYNGVRYFGGLKDNGNQYFHKQFINLPPHHKIILELQIMTFEFPQQITQNSILYKENSVTIQIDQQQIIKINPQNDEVQKIFSEIQHQATNLSIAMISVTSADTYFSFGISNLNIMIQRCQPLCRTCIGPDKNDCTEWIIEQNSQDQDCNSGFIFDIEQQKCALCPIGCQKCSDQKTCLKCEDTFIQQGSSCFCLNGNIDEFTLDCLVNPSIP